MAKAAVLGKTTKADLPKELFAEPFHQSLVARGRPRRPRLAPPRHRLDPDPRRGRLHRPPRPGARRAPAAPASARSASPAAIGGGVAFGPKPRHYTVKVNRKARRRAMRSALSVHAERGSVAVLDAAAFETPSTKQAAAGAGQMGRQAPDPGRPHRRGDRRDEELPQHPPRRTCSRSAPIGVADVIGAASLVVSESRAGDARRRGSADGRAHHPHPPGRSRRRATR